MQILKLELLTDRLEETEVFYSERLGLAVINKEKDSISFLAGSSTLTFLRSNEVSPKYHFAFNIPSNKLDEAIIWASNRTALIKNPDHTFVTSFNNWNAKSIYFYDTNGNVLEFIVRFDLENKSDGVFDKESIQSINEVGVVTERPLIFAENLIDEYGLNYFTKGPRREDFVALGDDNGLIVISNPSRNWYPTESKAEKHYLRVEIKTGNLHSQIIVNEKAVA